MGKKRTEIIRWFGPILDALRELGGSGKPKEVTEIVAKKEKLSNSELEATLPSGALKFKNQVAWARQYMVWEGYLDSTIRGTWKLTPKGQNAKISQDAAHKIFLKWVEINQKGSSNISTEDILEDIDKNEPENSNIINKENLLEILQNLTPFGFEKICLELLRESGFDNLIHTAATRDGGFDGYGTLELNQFISIKVLFQFKRYKGTVSRAQVGDFRNAMMGRAEKGIMLTTGIFSQDAWEEADRVSEYKIELVDGIKLVKMFQKAGVGVKPETIYKVDISFFEPYMEKK